MLDDSETTLIDTLYHEQMELAEYLRRNGQISFSQTVEATLSKTLLLACASYFESRITNAISDYASRVSGGDEALTSLVRIKALERQYHTYFAWKKGNRSANAFFGMFGSSFRDEAKRDLKESNLVIAQDNFLELGELRNLLVHENYATYPLDNTAAEIYRIYKQGLLFVQYVENKLNPPDGTVATGILADPT